MPSQNELNASPSSIVVGTATNGVATATTPTPGSVRAAVAVFGFLVTSSAVPAAPVVGTLSDGTTTLSFNLPATVFPHGFAVNFPNGHPFVGVAAQPVVLTIPALGAAVVCHASLFYGLVSAK